ncbi:MAG: hypothetical protein ACPKPY_09960 [Nitrososphaeraceae archaeon]
MKNSLFYIVSMLVTIFVLLLALTTINNEAQIENDLITTNISDMKENDFPMNISKLILETQ